MRKRWVVSVCERCGREGRHPYHREENGPDGWGVFEWRYNGREVHSYYSTSDTLRLVDHDHQTETGDGLFLCSECLGAALRALEGVIKSKPATQALQDEEMVSQALEDSSQFSAFLAQLRDIMDAVEKKPSVGGAIRTVETELERLRVLFFSFQRKAELEKVKG